MRYVTLALAAAFALGAVSVAQACPKMFETASTPNTVASADQQTTPSSTKIRIPAPKS